MENKDSEHNGHRLARAESHDSQTASEYALPYVHMVMIRRADRLIGLSTVNYSSKLMRAKLYPMSVLVFISAVAGKLIRCRHSITARNLSGPFGKTSSPA